MVDLPIPGLAPVRTIAIIVAHPDDEVIGLGGQLVRWGSAVSVVIISVTDGAPTNDADAHAAGFESSAAYASGRVRELDEALACLKWPPRTVRLGRTDQRVTHDLASVMVQLDELMDIEQPDAVVTHAYEGGHPDHDAVAVAVAATALRGHGRGFVHLEFAGYHEGAAGTLETCRFAAEPSCAAARIPLGPAEWRVKQLMLACFRSQQRTLGAFRRCDAEWLRVAPDYDFTEPPNAGRVWYDRFPWGVRSDEWRAIVAPHLPARVRRARC